MHESGKRTKIRWTDEEWELLEKRILELLREDRSLRLETALHRAEEEHLPRERQRLRQRVGEYGLSSARRLRDIYRRALEARREPAHPPEPTSPSREPAGEPHLNGTPKRPEPERPTESDPMKMIAELTQHFVRDLIARLDRIESALIARIGPPPGWQTLKPPMPPCAPAPRPKPLERTVAIVGLFKEQFEHVRQRVSHLPLRLVWVDKEDRHYRLPAADHVIVQRHSTHGWYEKARAQCGSEVTFCDGAISGVVQRLCDLHARHVQQMSRP